MTDMRRALFPSQLVETKSPQGQNLLHFVERTVSSLFHDMEGFMDELDKASEGSRRAYCLLSLPCATVHHCR